VDGLLPVEPGIPAVNTTYRGAVYRQPQAAVRNPEKDRKKAGTSKITIDTTPVRSRMWTKVVESGDK
jgi:hypothetical protein